MLAGLRSQRPMRPRPDGIGKSCRAVCNGLPCSRGTSDGSHPMVKVDRAATGIPRLSSGRATTVPFTAVMIGPERTATDNAQAASTCAASYFSQVTIPAIWLWEQMVGRGLHRPLPRPAGRSGPWSRRTGAPQASATGRDRNPRCSRDCSRDAPRHPGMSEYRMGRRCAVRPAEGLVEAKRAPASTPPAQFGF
jgi:hypothetical protein